MQKIKHISSSLLKNMDRFYRASLINSVSGFKAANLVGTISENGINNLALFSSITHLGADPALLGFIQRPLGEFSHTYKNIIRNNYYTINHVHADFIEQAHFTSAKFDEQTSEFDQCRLTPEFLHDFKAPFAAESRIKLGLKFVEEVPIRLNGTRLIIGEVEHIFIDEAALQGDGSLDLTKVNDVCLSGLETYHSVKRIKSFPYARPDNLPKFK